jgi:hypothetical protein
MNNKSEELKLEHPNAKNNFITPSYYMRKGHLQHIDIQESILSKEEFTGFCKALIIKYIAAKRENNRDNMLRAAKKAQYYITELVNYLLVVGNETVSEEHIKPSYYVTQKIQPIDIIDDMMPFEQVCGSYKGQIVRYITRSSWKGHEFDDLNKTKFYIDKFVDYLEKYKDDDSINK